MIKTLSYFPAQMALNSGPVISALLDSANSAGIKLCENSLDADAVVIWSALWAGRMQQNKCVHEHYRSLNKPVIFVEVGALHRGITWKISLNNVTAQGYYGHHFELDPDRPKKLSVSLQTNPLNHGRVLVAGQHNKSLQLEGINQESWYVQQIQNIDKQIVVRPHPRCSLDRSRFPSHVVWEQPKKLANTYDSFDMHWDFDAVINYNSGPGIQAVIAGVPAVTDHSSLAHNVIDREQWLIEICHTEYTVEEIQKGLWVKRIIIS